MDLDLKRGLFFLDGHVLRPDCTLIAAGFNSDPDGDSSRLVFLHDTSWRHLDIETDAIVSVTSVGESGIAIGSGGLALKIPLRRGTSPTWISEHIEMWTIDATEDLGELTRVRGIGTIPFACGQSGQVYQLGNSGWARVGSGLDGDHGPDLEDIDGTGPSNLYCVGIGGAMHRYDGARWRRVDIPTNQNLSGIRCVSDRLSYACGDEGVVLRGNCDTWELVSDPIPDRNYWGLDVFEGILHLSHSGGIDRLTPTGIQPVSIPNVAEYTFNRVHSRDSELWSFGPDHVLAYRSGAWKPISIPVNQ